MFGSRIKMFSKSGKHYYKFNLYDGRFIAKQTLSDVINRIDCIRKATLLIKRHILLYTLTNK